MNSKTSKLSAPLAIKKRQPRRPAVEHKDVLQSALPPLKEKPPIQKSRSQPRLPVSKKS